MHEITTDANGKITVNTDKLLSFVKKTIKKLENEINILRLKKHCPFYNMFGDKIKCPYKDDGHVCYDINVAPGNSDAWCTEMIERGIIDTELHYEDKDDEKGDCSV